MIWFKFVPEYCLFPLAWACLLWSLPVILKFQMVERAGNISDKAASPQSLPAVGSTFLLSPRELSCFIYLDDLWPRRPVSAGLSTELQTVLKMMLVPEPSERPTVAELLALPSVRKHRWKRRIYLVVTETLLTLTSLCQVSFQTLTFWVWI